MSLCLLTRNALAVRGGHVFNLIFALLELLLFLLSVQSLHYIEILKPAYESLQVLMSALFGDFILFYFFSSMPELAYSHIRPFCDITRITCSLNFASTHKFYWMLSEHLLTFTDELTVVR